MRLLNIFSNFFVVVSLIFLISSIVGLALNRPVLFSYAVSESMEPTIQSGDLFFINPLSKGDEGSIIVFKMGELYVVHRVYGIENDRYVTKGDNNIATDQFSGKTPLINKDDVIGEVITFSEKPILIPGAGKIIESIHSSSMLVAAALITLGFLSIGGSKRKRNKKKWRISNGVFYGLASSALVVSLVASTMLTWGEISFSYASTAAGGQRDGWYLPGSNFERSLSFENKAYYPLIFFFKKDWGNGELISQKVAYMNPRDKLDLDFRVSVPEETRIYSEKVKVYSYLPLLPIYVTVELFNISPLLPLLVQMAILLSILMGVYIAAGFGEDYFVLRKRRLRI